VAVVQFAVHLAGLNEGDVAVVVGVVGKVVEVVIGDESFEQLLHDGFGGIVLASLSRSIRDMNVFMR
jgi:hypothetical protein